MDDAGGYVALDAVLMPGGSSVASRRRGLPEATLSKRVARLEGPLRMHALERARRNARATDSCKQIFEQAQSSSPGSERLLPSPPFTLRNPTTSAGWAARES